MNISKHTDILVIGNSLFGAIAAISTADEGKNILFIMKNPILKSGNTPKAREVLYIKVKQILRKN